SFVHTLARYVCEAGVEAKVLRNDACAPDAIIDLAPNGVVLSPGPGRPVDTGVSIPLIQRLPLTTPVLGVCLGHQAIAEAFGGRTVRAKTPMHGRASFIRHDGSGIFAGLPSPFAAGRYHSLASDISGAGGLKANAWTEDGEIMGLAHVARPIFGVQFHPESLLTPHGRIMIENFVAVVKRSAV
ncbi:MAG: aminodeoxychorismate/anthranilate synthase component II, partial [Pseudomonadota bacterium]